MDVLRLPYQLTFAESNRLAIVWLVTWFVPVHNETLANQFHNIIFGVIRIAKATLHSKDLCIEAQELDQKNRGTKESV